MGFNLVKTELGKIGSTEYKKRNMNMWNEIAHRYHKRWAGANTGPFQSTKKLVELVGVKKGDKILDVACGTGVVTRRVAGKVGNAGYVVGADTSIMALKIAKKWNQNNSNIYFVNADAEKINFAEKFDIITCQYALFFFPNAVKALKNMRYNLKDSGRLGIAVHGNNVPFFSSIVDSIIEWIPDYIPLGTPKLDRYGTKTALKKEIKNAGFSGISVKDFIFRYTPGTFENYWQNYLRYIPRPLKEKLNLLSRTQKKLLKEAVYQNTKKYTKRDETIDFPWQVLILTAKML